MPQRENYPIDLPPHLRRCGCRTGPRPYIAPVGDPRSDGNCRAAIHSVRPRGIIPPPMRTALRRNSSSSSYLAGTKSEKERWPDEVEWKPAGGKGETGDPARSGAYFHHSDAIIVKGRVASRISMVKPGIPPPTPAHDRRVTAEKDKPFFALRPSGPKPWHRKTAPRALPNYRGHCRVALLRNDSIES